MKRGWMVWLAALLLTVCFAACGKEEAPAPVAEPAPVTAEQPKPEPEPAPEPEPEPIDPDTLNPLTGLPLVDAGKHSARPVAVIHNNLQVALPQLGVSQADVIYEVPAEGGVTRMLALYQEIEQVENLGSIRSTRPYYLELALGHESIFLHAGGSEEAYADIKLWDVDNIDGVRGYGSQEKVFWRDAERKKSAGYEHSLLSSGARVVDYLAAGKLTLAHGADYTEAMLFAQAGSAAVGESAKELKVQLTGSKTTSFTYDDATGAYQISQYGAPYMDGNSNTQVSATNVLVLKTEIDRIPGDTEGRLTVRTTGSGEGYCFSGGKFIAMKWSRPDRNSPLTYTTAQGQPLLLQPGVSYICVVDDGRTVTYQ